MASFFDLKGKTLTNIEVGDNTIDFYVGDTEHYRLYHNQDCCESVYIEDINGDVENLIGSPILVAEEMSDSYDSYEPAEGDRAPLSEYDESYTWTFYKLATIKGSVDIRFYGTSNGYYSESVDFVDLNNN